MICIKCKEHQREVKNWCKECHYPGIEDDWQMYQDLLAEGYRRADALVRSGYMGYEEVEGEE